MLIEFGRKGTTFLSNNDAVVMIFFTKIIFFSSVFPSLHIYIKFVRKLYFHYDRLPYLHG